MVADASATSLQVQSTGSAAAWVSTNDVPVMESRS
jgi:hypothetical protein